MSESEKVTAQKSSMKRFLWGFVVIALFAAGWLWLRWNESQKQAQQAEHQQSLEKQAELRQSLNQAVEKRQWPKAEKLLDSYIQAGGSSEQTRVLTTAIIKGSLEEKRQRLGYLAGEVRVKVEEGLWDKAEQSLAEILRLDPEYKEQTLLRGLIDDARNAEKLQTLRKQITQAVNEKKFTEADKYIAELNKLDHAKETHSEMQNLLNRVKKRNEKDKRESQRLTAEAKKLDKGVFSQMALDSLRLALALDASNGEAQRLLKKMSAYGRTIQVPEDYVTLQEAVAAARPNDTILLGKGTFTGSFTLKEGMSVRGAGFDETIIECASKQGNVFVFKGQSGQSASISDLMVRHKGFSQSNERFALITANGGQLNLAKVKLIGSAGHGLAILSGAHVQALSSRFTGSGWDGIAVSGAGSKLTLRDCAVTDNLHSGIAAWNGGVIDAENSHIEQNIHSGISLGSANGHRVHDVRLIRNRHSGLIVQQGARATVSEVTAQKNVMGGIVLMTGAQASLEKCLAQSNGLGGFVYAKGAKITKESGNKARKNGSGRRDNVKKEVGFAKK